MRIISYKLFNFLVFFQQEKILFFIIGLFDKTKSNKELEQYMELQRRLKDRGPFWRLRKRAHCSKGLRSMSINAKLIKVLAGFAALESKI